MLKFYIRFLILTSLIAIFAYIIYGFFIKDINEFKTVEKGSLKYNENSLESLISSNEHNIFEEKIKSNIFIPILKLTKNYSITDDLEKNSYIISLIPSNITINKIRQDKIGKNIESEIVFDLSVSEKIEKETVRGIIELGDTIDEILYNAMGNNDVYYYISIMEKVFSSKLFNIGQPYTIIKDLENGGIKKFEYEISSKEKLVVEGNNPPIAKIEKIEYDIKLAYIEASIKYSLFQSVTDANETPMLAINLAKIYAWEINFIKDIRENDSFVVLFEKLYRFGTFKGYGRILGAEFINQGDKFEAYLFHNGQKNSEYYNEIGGNLKKVLLQSPLTFTRVTSKFSYKRKHPILKIVRPHLGIDYGAPTGTPIMAVGDGIVTVKGWVGGYGNHIALKHEAGLVSMYSHMSRFARNIKKGKKVRQGQVIGYVGSTGLSTGPHLDFRLKQAGKYINPAKAINPRAEAVFKKYKQEFEQQKIIVKKYMNKETALEIYKVEQ